VARSLPPPDSPTRTIDLSAYRIGPTDEIVVTVFGAPELGREGSVDAAGNFSLPLAGTVVAAGKTPDELASAIADKFRGQYLKNPQVVVNIKTARAQTVTIDGAVREPGVYPVVGKLTLQQAIATAKGASDAANISNVIVFRTVNGQKMAAMFNLRDVRSGRYEDPQIYGNDIIVVGESAFRRFFKDYVSAFPVLGSFIPVL
jgi:polysaccharide export outer membrane protein